MKSLIIGLICLSSTSVFASRIPFCNITFGGIPEGVGIHKPMNQRIKNSLVKYDYHFESLIVDVSFNLAVNNKGMVLMIDRKTNEVVSYTYAALLDGPDETLEANIKLGDAIYQVGCKYADEIPESDKVEELSRESVKTESK